MLSTAGTFSTGVTLVLTQCFKNITLILLSFECLAPLSPRLQGQEGMQNMTRLDHAFWNEISLDEIIETYILKSRELRVN